jgi:hypothetical protein
VGEYEKQEQIRVEDKRRFDAEGNPTGQPDAAIPVQEQPASAGRPKGPGPSHSPERVSFVSILFSYVHSTLICLGDIDDPVKQAKVESLDGARHMIDILELLEEKTKGNLSPEEQQYLESALFDLRMRYMQKAKLIK